MPFSSEALSWKWIFALAFQGYLRLIPGRGKLCSYGIRSKTLRFFLKDFLVFSGHFWCKGKTFHLRNIKVFPWGWGCEATLHGRCFSISEGKLRLKKPQGSCVPTVPSCNFASRTQSKKIPLAKTLNGLPQRTLTLNFKLLKRGWLFSLAFSTQSWEGWNFFH